MKRKINQKEIFEKYLLGNENSQDFDEIDAILNQNTDENMSFDVDKSFIKLKGQLQNSINTSSKINKISYIAKWATVAAILLIACTAVLYFSNNLRETNLTISELNNLKPAENSIIISFDNHKEFDVQKDIHTINDALGINNQISKKLDFSKANISTLGKIEVPKGKMFDFTLSDGSRVWLNAGSKLIFPTQFSTDIREVELYGEAYFEVARNPHAKFIVNSHQQRLEVLGTKFNLSSFGDGDDITVLAEGKVKITNSKNNERIISPGQMTAVGEDAIKMFTVNAENYVVWKDGFFCFNDASAHDVIKSLARWYDFDVNLENEDSKERFTGKIATNTSLSDIMTILKSVGVKINVYKKQNQLIISK